MNSWKHFPICLLLILAGNLSAQVVNTEVKRLADAKEGWTGNADLSLNLIRNTRDIFQVGTRMNFHYRKEKHRLMLLNDIGMLRANQDDLVNKGFLHARYSYELRRFLIPEGFIQGQYNEIQLIQVRALAGLGPRYRIVENDSVRLYLGTLYMYEYERIQDQDDPNLAHRMSAYLSFDLALSKTVNFQTITYFQPRLDWWGDHRISSESSLRFQIAKYFYFSTLFNILYDTNPPDGLQNTFYTFKNAIGVNF